MKVSIGISNHHVHVTEEDLKILYGENATLTKLKDIHQPGQYAAEEKVDIKTEAGILKGLRILGPCRNYTQVELSQTDCRNLKISVPVRTSGDLEGAGVVEIIGPKGTITRSAAIIADRHIHITPKMKEDLGLSEINEVKVKISGQKGGIFDHVHLKVTDEAYYEMHIDTDDGNGFLIENGEEGEILL